VLSNKNRFMHCPADWLADMVQAERQPLQRARPVQLEIKAPPLGGN
jgi:hypothetical protein